MKVVNNIIQAIEDTKKIVFSKSEILELIKSQTYCVLPAEITSNGVTITPETRTVFDSNTGKTHNLSKKEFDLLYYLMDNSNKNVTRYEIFRDVWGNNSNTRDRTIDVHIRKLRSVINPKFIRTDKGVGYKWDGNYFNRLKRLEIN